MVPRALATALVVSLACSSRPREPRQPTEAVPEATLDAGPGPHMAAPRDAASDATASVATPRFADAAAPDDAAPQAADAAPAVTPPLARCDALPARSDPARWRLPADLLGKARADIEARFGAPWCGGGDVYQWRLPRGCAYQKQVITVWFHRGKAQHIVSQREITGQHCEPAW